MVTRKYTQSDSGPETAPGKHAGDAVVSTGSDSGSGQESSAASAGGGTVARNRSRNRGIVYTLGHLPPALGSIAAVWTGRPDSIYHTVSRISSASDPDVDTNTKLIAAWLIVTLIPRTILHLLSWILTSPARTLLISIAIALTIACT